MFSKASSLQIHDEYWGIEAMNVCDLNLQMGMNLTPKLGCGVDGKIVGPRPWPNNLMLALSCARFASVSSWFIWSSEIVAHLRGSQVAFDRNT